VKKLMVLVLALVVVVGIACFKRDASGLEGGRSASIPLRTEPDFWLVQTSDLHAPMAALSITDGASQINNALALYSSLPAMQPLVTLFKGHKFRSAIIKPDGNVIAAERFIIGEPVVCVVPRESFSGRTEIAKFLPDILNGCVSVAAIQWGDKVWEHAVYLHEVLHYQKFLTHQASAIGYCGAGNIVVFH